jgi:drug/metabolite transporter (DMT)-like permease
VGSVPTKLLVIAVAVNAVVGQLFLKRALAALGGAAALANLPRFFLSATKSPWIYASLAVQALSYALWMILISRTKLGVSAATVGATFYILLPLCAWFVYGETLSYLQWLGIAFITVGVTCVSLGSN